MADRRGRRTVAVVIPVAVPVTMALVFGGLRRLASARTAYNIGFAVYWIVWCLAVPGWLLGPRDAARLLITGRGLPARYLMLLAMPVAGAAGTQLIPQRRDVDIPTAAAMASTAIVNAVGEELLWRAVFLREFDSRPRLAMAWSLFGFSLWHVAPQLVLPSPLGRGRFVAGSAVVGLASSLAAWKAGGLRQVVVAHAITDACGVRAARFRLGR
ncbi:MAG: CPBP family intramembrane metalloprotease [Mycobacterium sp.]|nr:CPBP family intramembrane metalloprotease [Mycobacterium sp.]